MKHKACQKEHLRYLVRKDSTPKGNAHYLEILEQKGNEAHVICYYPEQRPWHILKYDYKTIDYYRPATEKDLPNIKQLVHKIKLEFL